MIKILSSLLCCLLFTGCIGTAKRMDNTKITSINIIDRNGMTETISAKERLASFDKTDFTAPQPYQKVLRVYGRDQNNNTRSCITSYHPNGQLKQSLEAINNRAFGSYVEYYANGQKKIESTVIGGVADINTQSEQSWLFDGVSKAWDDNGHLLAEIHYDKGALEGTSIHYHTNGAIWKKSHFKKNQLEGKQEIYLKDGSLFQTATYEAGEKHGEALRYWEGRELAYKEFYERGRLITGKYFDRENQKVAAIANGWGVRAIFGKEGIEELQEFKEGLQEGFVKVFTSKGELSRHYFLHEGEKEGEEIDYYLPQTEGMCKPKLLITWHKGIMQGIVQSWYPEGQLQSRKEISQNQKNGLSTGWYENGSIMYVEEYDNDILVKGEYYRMNEQEPISWVKQGEGTVTLFDPRGSLLQKIHYQDGKPSV